MTQTALSPGADTAAPSRRPGVTVTLDVVVPVHNEEAVLERTVRTLRAHLDAHLPFPARVTIADNASTDRTAAIADSLVRTVPGVRAVHLSAKGRGRALKQVWLGSDADVVAYMDVDLSTDLAALLPLVAPLVSGHSDLAIGTRLTRNSRVTRGPRREVISRGYNLILRGTLRAHFSDAQCGFKAMRTDVARRLLPLVEDTGWFFDTEVLVLAERAGLRIHEVPVDWVDDPDSRVDIVDTALEDLKGVWRIGTGLATGRIRLAEVRPGATTDPVGVPRGMTGQLARFAVVGVASTLAYALLYLTLQPAVGPQAANVVSLLVTAVANTAANRLFTFGVRGRRGLVGHHASGLVLFAVGLALTSGMLWLSGRLWPDAGRHVELAVLVVANALATLVRFVGLRGALGRRPAVTPVPPVAVVTPGTSASEETTR